MSDVLWVVGLHICQRSDNPTAPPNKGGRMDEFQIVDFHSMTDSEFVEWAEVFLAVARDAMAAFVEEK